MKDGDCCGFDFEGWAGPGGRKGRRGRRGHRVPWKIFERGDLKFVILRLISKKPMHGYEAMQALEEESGGWYKASPGSVYPTLQMLEEAGYLSSEEKDGKKIYTITDEGREYLKEHGDVVDEIFDRISAFAERFWGREIRNLSSSFSRLAHTAFEEAFWWGEDPEMHGEIKDILDRAWEEIEKVRRKARGKHREEDDSSEEE